MNLLEIIMLILGVLFIIISCRIVAHPDRKSNGVSIDNVIMDISLQEEFNTIKEQQVEKINNACEETVTRTEDYLSKLSNEKIMAVSEYSDQIIEKITKNHEEVVFLYNMLNSKEKELKETVREIQGLQKRAKEAVIDKEENAVADKDKAKPKQLGTQMQGIRKQLLVNSVNSSKESSQSTISINNAEILKLYSQGNSVLDIARRLGIGQGEVKLVVDLFSDR